MSPYLFPEIHQLFRAIADLTHSIEISENIKNSETEVHGYGQVV
jgi:hypothetical protein